MTERAVPRFVPTEDGIIMMLWHEHKVDTIDIARAIGRPEFHVYNRLMRAKESARG